MKISLMIAALIVATPVVAQDAQPIRAGKTLVDAEGKRVGKIERVMPDGSLRLIVGGKFVVVPAATISTKDGTTATSLSKREINRL